MRRRFGEDRRSGRFDYSGKPVPSWAIRRAGYEAEDLSELRMPKRRLTKALACCSGASPSHVSRRGTPARNGTGSGNGVWEEATPSTFGRWPVGDQEHRM